MDADAVLEEWLGRDGEYSPGYYAHYGPNDTSAAILAFLDATVGSDAAVLELGCSSGRHLAHLHDHGYDDLTGVEINPDAGDVMVDAYPALAETGVFYYDAIENVVTEFADDRFDAVFSVETLQHIHADNAWVFQEIARITDDAIVTAEIETGEDSEEADVTYIRDDFPLYYRNWRDVFTPFGFTEVEHADVGRDTFRGFRADD